MKSGIENLTDEELENFVNNYQRARKTEGGKYPLSSLVLEQEKRKKSHFSGRETVEAIIRLCRQTREHHVTYGTLYSCLAPRAVWKGNATQSLMSKVLDKAAYYCVSNQLPILTVLVVRVNGKLSEEAVLNIYNYAKKFGLEVGFDPIAYIDEQVHQSLKFVSGEIELPA